MPRQAWLLSTRTTLYRHSAVDRRPILSHSPIDTSLRCWRPQHGHRGNQADYVRNGRATSSRMRHASLWTRRETLAVVNRGEWSASRRAGPKGVEADNKSDVGERMVVCCRRELGFR